MLWFQKSKR